MEIKTFTLGSMPVSWMLHVGMSQDAPPLLGEIGMSWAASPPTDVAGILGAALPCMSITKTSSDSEEYVDKTADDVSPMQQLGRDHHVVRRP